MEILQAVDSWLDLNAWWLDVAALFVVCGVAFKVGNFVALFVLCEFALVILGYSP